jgi:hypothetical protein
MLHLVDNEDRGQAAFKRLDHMFPVNRGLRQIFLLMANAHRRAIDYIEQAPVIVAAATRGQAHVSVSECAFVKEQLSQMCESGTKLRDVMRAYGLPLPLRLLDARALTSTRATVIRRLALMNPSTLAQIIPASPQKQNAWLQALQNWCDGMALRSEANNNQCLSFEWAAINYPGITYREADGVRHMVDFAYAHPDTFNPRWPLNCARAEEQRWHAELAVTKMAECGGVPLHELIDYAPLPLLWMHGDLSLIALQSGKALYAEGVAMHHCVATYWRNVIDGRSRIYSILENGSHVATLEVSNRSISHNWGTSQYQVRQLVGTCNSRPAPKVAKAVGTFVDEINDRLGGSGAAVTGAHDELTTTSAVGVAQ